MPQQPSQTDYGHVVVLLGRKVAAVRAARGLTQTDLANLAGIERKSLQNIEYARSSMRAADGSYGRGNPKLDTVFAIATALEVEVGYLVDPRRPLDPIPE